VVIARPGTVASPRARDWLPDAKARGAGPVANGKVTGDDRSPVDRGLQWAPAVRGTAAISIGTLNPRGMTLVRSDIVDVRHVHPDVRNVWDVAAECVGEPGHSTWTMDFKLKEKAA